MTKLISIWSQKQSAKLLTFIKKDFPYKQYNIYKKKTRMSNFQNGHIKKLKYKLYTKYYKIDILAKINKLKKGHV